MSLLLVALAAGPAPATPPVTTVDDSTTGFAFDLPGGCTAQGRAAPRGGAMLGDFDVAGPDGVAQLEVHAQQGLDAPSGAGADAARALDVVRRGAGTFCEAGAPDGAARVDHVSAIRRSANRFGFAVYEVRVDVVMDRWNGVLDDGAADVDSTGPETVPRRDAPRAALVADPYTRARLFAVDLSGDGTTLWVWIRPFCTDGDNTAAESLARAIARSVRRR